MRNKKLIISILLVFLINLGIISSWFYLYYMLGIKKNNVDKINFQIGAIEKKMGESHSLKTFLEEIEEDKKRVESIFLTKETIVDFVRDLEGLARSSGVAMKLTSINIDNIDELGGAHLKLSVNGEFGEVYRYLTLLENIKYQTSVEVAYLQTIDGKWLGNLEVILRSYVK